MDRKSTGWSYGLKPNFTFELTLKALCLEAGFYQKINEVHRKLKNQFPQSTITLYSFLALIAGITASIIFQSRAFIVGFSIAIAYFGASAIPDYKKYKGRYLLIGLFFFTSAVPALALLFKTGSTFGRILIYKISYRIYIENWLSGIGYGNFQSQYLQFQAQYFAEDKWTISEMLLAGNTYYAFNDYWQFVIEGGVKSVIILLVGTIFLFTLYSRTNNVITRKNQTYIRVIWSFLIAFLIAAFFTHLWGNELYVYTVLQLLLILIYLSYFKRTFKTDITFFATSTIAAFTVCSFLNRNEIFNYKQHKKYEQAKKLCYAGYVAEGLDLLEDVHKDLRYNSSFLQFYSIENMKLENFSLALNLLLEAAKIHPSNEIYRQVGLCYDNLGDYNKANEALLKSVNMVPNRFVNRYDLFCFYKKHKRYNQALEVGQKIISMPVKIASATVDTIKSLVGLDIKTRFSNEL